MDERNKLRMHWLLVCSYQHLYGGVGQGIDYKILGPGAVMLVATPDRLLDIVSHQPKLLSLAYVRWSIAEEINASFAEQFMEQRDRLAGFIGGQCARTNYWNIATSFGDRTNNTSQRHARRGEARANLRRSSCELEWSCHHGNHRCHPHGSILVHRRLPD